MDSLKILILAFFLLSLATASAFATRQTALSSPVVDGPQAERFGRLKEALDLTSEQEVTIRTIITENKQGMVGLRKKREPTGKSCDNSSRPRSLTSRAYDTWSNNSQS